MKILLVDDHALIRDGIKLILKSDPALEFAGETGNGKEALAMHKKLHPDLIIMDIDMPVMNCIEALKEIRKTDKDVKIIILTMYDKESYLYDGLNAGINGYLIKLASMSELIQVIHTVNLGMDVFSPGILQILTRQLNIKTAVKHLHNKAGVILSTREKEIVLLIADGHSNKQIAESLFLSVFTIKNHRKNIMRKLGFKRVNELIRYAIEMDYLK